MQVFTKYLAKFKGLIPQSDNSKHKIIKISGVYFRGVEVQSTNKSMSLELLLSIILSGIPFSPPKKLNPVYYYMYNILLH